jgi:hypothetical protein
MSPLEVNLNGKTFRVVRNDGMGAEVTTDTIFHFRQESPVAHGTCTVYADYSGGKVRTGKLVGILSADRTTMHHTYLQMNLDGVCHSGESTDEVRITERGKIQLIDSWEWKSRKGKGLCIMEEV